MELHYAKIVQQECNMLPSKVIYVIYCPNNFLNFLLVEIELLRKALLYYVLANSNKHLLGYQCILTTLQYTIYGI